MSFGSEEMALLIRAVEGIERIESKLDEAPPRRPYRGAGRSYASALSFIRVQLMNGPKPWADVLAAAQEFGHSKGTLERARREIAETQYIDRRWIWRLKEQ